MSTKIPTSMILNLSGITVLSRSAMAALTTQIAGQSVSLFENGIEGKFIWRLGDYSLNVAADTLKGVYVASSTVSAAVGCWVREFDRLLNVKWFGAKGDNSTNDRPAIDAAFSLATKYARGIYLPIGYYKYDCAGLSAIWDFTEVPSGFVIEGDGLQLTEIRPINPPATGNTAIYWYSSGPTYDKVIKGLTFRASFNGTTLTIGKNDLTDSFETPYFERFAVFNEYAGSGVSEALRTNYMLGGLLNGCRFGCYASGSGANYGTAWRMRQSCFNIGNNVDYGNADCGMKFTDFGSYGNVFNGGGSENCNYHVMIMSALAKDNQWNGGRMSLWTQYALYSDNGDSSLSSRFGGIAYRNGSGPSTIVDPAHSSGIYVY